MPIGNLTKATIDGGKLNLLGDCFVRIPVPNKGPITIYLDILPEISDTKSAHYNDEPVIGRSFPIKTYAYSDNRSISMKLHFVIWNGNGGVNDRGTPAYNLQALRAIQSAVYPVDDTAAPYEPPPICQIRCGQLLSLNNPLCVVLKQYSFSVPTDCAWDEATKCPYRFEVDTNWDVVYRSTYLPGQSKIISDGGDPTQQTFSV